MPNLSSALSALNDLVFKFIFGTEVRKELLREFVNIVLARVGLPLAAELTLRNPFNLKQTQTDKESILDIGATDETGRMFDIEVQLSSQRSYGSRALCYWSRQYSARARNPEILRSRFMWHHRGENLVAL